MASSACTMFLPAGRWISWSPSNRGITCTWTWSTAWPDAGPLFCTMLMPSQPVAYSQSRSMNLISYSAYYVPMADSALLSHLLDSLS